MRHSFHCRFLRRRMRGFAVLLAQSVDKKWTVKGKSPWSSQSSGKDELSICWQGDLLVTWLQTACAVRLTESARLAMTQRQKGTFWANYVKLPGYWLRMFLSIFDDFSTSMNNCNPTPSFSKLIWTDTVCLRNWWDFMTSGLKDRIWPSNF